MLSTGGKYLNMWIWVSFQFSTYPHKNWMQTMSIFNFLDTESQISEQKSYMHFISTTSMRQSISPISCQQIYIYTCIYIYMYTYIYISYIYMYTCIYIYVYIYIHLIC
jgi:hypothetical protein